MFYFLLFHETRLPPLRTQLLYVDFLSLGKPAQFAYAYAYLTMFFYILYSHKSIAFMVTLDIAQDLNYDILVAITWGVKESTHNPNNKENIWFGYGEIK